MNKGEAMNDLTKYVELSDLPLRPIAPFERGEETTTHISDPDFNDDDEDDEDDWDDDDDGDSDDDADDWDDDDDLDDSDPIEDDMD
jgi:hypothetical protein